MGMLQKGQLLRSVFSQLDYRVSHLIGEGGQGEVYIVEGGHSIHALKWYNAQVLRVDRGLYGRLKVAIDRGAPSAKFLWPFELVTLPDGSGLGYLMRVRNPSFLKMHDLMANAVTPSFRSLATLGCLLTDALYAVHSRGLAYQDLNAGNAFFDPNSGDIEICDNDNVDIDGAPSVIGGVWEFQAPEVVMRRSSPTRATDLHSLAVMLFRILHVGHPLLGRRESTVLNTNDVKAIQRVYGSEACFIFDPMNDTNRPLPEQNSIAVAHWNIYPEFIRELFIQAFTEGLHDPFRRVQETVWRSAMSRLRDSVMSCPHCGVKNFYDLARLNMKPRQETFPCWSCEGAIKSQAPRMGIRPIGSRSTQAAKVLVLDRGAQLFGHHDGSEYDFSKPIGEVTYESPDEIPYLVNRSGSNWSATVNEISVEVRAGAKVRLDKGMRIRFPNSEGEIKA